MKYGKLVLCVILLSIITISPVNAEVNSTSTEKKLRMTSREEVKANIEKKREEKKTLRTLEQTERKEKRAEIKLKLKSEVKSRIENRLAIFEANSLALWQGLENQDKRLEEVIRKWKEKGLDVTEAEELLTEARRQLIEAKAAVTKAVNEAKTSLGGEEVSRQTLLGIIESAQDLRKEAHQSYKAVLQSLKKLKEENKNNQ